MALDKGREMTDADKYENDTVGLLMAKLDEASAIAEEYDWSDWPNLNYPPALMNEAREAIADLYRIALKARVEAISFRAARH